MKTKQSMKITELYDRFYQIGGSRLNRLLYEIEPSFYNTGAYGWNNETYTFCIDGEKIGICTGYRNMRGAHISYKLAVKYEELAQEVDKAYYNSYEERRKAKDNLIQKFLKELIKNEQ